MAELLQLKKWHDECAAEDQREFMCKIEAILLRMPHPGVRAMTSIKKLAIAQRVLRYEKHWDAVRARQSAKDADAGCIYKSVQKH